MTILTIINRFLSAGARNLLIQRPGPALATHTPVETESTVPDESKSSTQNSLSDPSPDTPACRCSRVPREDVAPLKGLLAKAGKARRAGRFLLPARRSGAPLCTEPAQRRCEEGAATLHTLAGPEAFCRRPV